MEQQARDPSIPKEPPVISRDVQIEREVIPEARDATSEPMERSIAPEGYEFEPKEASCDTFVPTTTQDVMISLDKSKYNQGDDLIKITVIAPSFNLSPYEIDCFGGGSFTGPIPDSGFGELPDSLKAYTESDVAVWSEIKHTFYIFAGAENKKSPFCHPGYDNQCYDNILNFKLMETDRDTGVFTGSVSIVEPTNYDEEDDKIEYACDEYDDGDQIIVTVREYGSFPHSPISASADLVNCYVYPANAIPNTVNIDIPTGTSVPGCEETHSCYDPSEKTLHVGAIVEWTNVDTAAHTVTSGTPLENVGDVFDSSLILSGDSYSFTFENAGNYDYFCMIHPWMAGTITIQ
jgi:plastocyanin